LRRFVQEKRAGGEKPRAVTGFADTVLAYLLKPAVATLIACAAPRRHLGRGR